MTPQEHSLNLAVVFGAIFSGYVSPTLAAVLGGYAAIVLSAVAGAGWALSRSDKVRTRMQALAYVVLLVLTSGVLTATAARIIERAYPSIESIEALAPVALIIAAVGEDWPQLARYVAGVVMRRRFGPAPQEKNDA